MTSRVLIDSQPSTSLTKSSEIVIKNTDASIIKMLDTVSKTQNKRKAVRKTHQVAAYASLKQMESFVMS
ncbi:hypothetical protein [Olivibacter sitiensis]|uniref:hypothetical protein n=1 Tax=Olivibacter sitiensis TaxID=376470 RepID=UPI000403FC38|nr:hypothetical protein [Olivibacter sitiensis]